MLKHKLRPRKNYYYIIVTALYCIIAFLIIFSAILGILFKSYARLVGQWVSLGMEFFSSKWALNETYWEQYGRIVSFSFVCMAPLMLLFIYCELIEKLHNWKVADFAYKLIWAWYIAGVVLDVVFYIHTKENFAIIPKDSVTIESSTIVKDWLAMVVKKFSFYALPITGQLAFLGTNLLWIRIENKSLRCTVALLSMIFVLAVITVATSCVVGLIAILLVFILAKFIFNNIVTAWGAPSPNEVRLSDGTYISPSSSGDYTDSYGNHYRDCGNGYWEKYDDD